MNPTPRATLRIIVAAQAVGIVALSAVFVVLVVVGSVEPTTTDATLFLVILGMVGLSEAPAYVAVRSAILNQYRPQRDAGGPSDPGAPFATLTLIGSALAEGFGLLGAVFYVLTGSLLALIAPLVALLLLLAQFPTDDRYESFAAALEH